MSRSKEQDISEVVDEIVDDLDVSRVEDEAHRLEIKEADLLERVMVEAKTRLVIQ